MVFVIGIGWQFIRVSVHWFRLLDCAYKSMLEVCELKLFVVISCIDGLDYVCVDIIYMKHICFRISLHDLYL
jgi:hypothetical protein